MSDYIQTIKDTYEFGKHRNPGFDPIAKHLDGDCCFFNFKSVDQVIEYIEQHCGEEKISRIKGPGLTEYLVVESDEDIGSWTMLLPIPDHKYVAMFYKNSYYRFHGKGNTVMEDTDMITVELVLQEDHDTRTNKLAIADIRPGHPLGYSVENESKLKPGMILTGRKLLDLGYETVTEDPI